MRILLDESVASRLGSLLTGHSTITVQRKGWTSIKNGKLLALAAKEFDVLLTARRCTTRQTVPGSVNGSLQPLRQLLNIKGKI